MESEIEIKPVKFGAEVRGVKLSDPVPDDVIERIKIEVHKHNILIFKDQGKVTGDRHVEISKWFGNLESTFYKHHRSPHPDVFRVSNDKEEGCMNVGRTGWHIDGSFMHAPFAYSLYHMYNVPQYGNTGLDLKGQTFDAKVGWRAFISLNELIRSVSPEKKADWDRLWMISDSRSGVIHPMIYPHPVTGLETMCFHLGMTESFAWDYGTEEERITDWDETVQILKDIYAEITKDNRRLIYSHKWQEGDFIISDNLAVGHEATPETQFPREQVGLRILHRTTIRGKHKPSKSKS